MTSDFTSLRNEPGFRAAILVPIAIMGLIVPLGVTGLASLTLATVISLLLGDGALFIKLWGLVWLIFLGLAELLPFQIVGETLRATILLGEVQLSWQPALISMAIGLLLIVSRGAIRKT